MMLTEITRGDLYGDSRAVVSGCGGYRYALWRRWDGGEGTCLFVMLNPSTGDAFGDDPTLRRCIGFARGWGFGELAVGNLYGARSADPAVLAGLADPVGPENEAWLARLLKEADVVVAAWGAMAPERRVREVVGQIEGAGARMRCLGLTGKGCPRHPLYVKGGTVLVGFGG
jgi:hypothetical protein